MSVRRSPHWLAVVGAAALGVALLGSPPAAAAPDDVSRAPHRPGGSVRVVDLTSAPDGGTAQAVRISDRGVVIGNVTGGRTDFLSAFRWEAGRLLVLDGLAGVDAPDTVANDVDVRGRVVGTSSAPDGTTHAVLWQPDGTVVDLGAPGQGSIAHAINRHGVVAGQVSTPSGPQAVVWRDGVVVPLGDLGGGYTTATAAGRTINDAGQVAGTWYTPEGTRAFRWDDGEVTVLPTPDGSTQTYPIAINERGDVLVGVVTSAPGATALVWEGDGDVVELVGPDGQDVAARAINDRGDVTGSLPSAGGSLHAFLHRRGTATDLGTLGGAESAGEALNRRGQVVGYSSLADMPGTTRAALWDGGRVLDLGGLDGGNLAVPLDLDDCGRVVGYGTDADGNQHALLWVVGRRGHR